ncbi:RNA polymerase sigma factor [Allorhodopirellula solitaria]|uniref:ECF RNA polymerase sigma factor SigE n=1 Tax=Allorhodopirellula solitaria TaxID=2527987 RepID=A0A5C5YKK3_9BACT|nr:sigma-70 family RNA polymerase sigma factor [Allorhodopirellula solitaria]TWT75414.1 ECF RNA polymerase sigma factor SigE [Allorhodopirellula solitaria]
MSHFNPPPSPVSGSPTASQCSAFASFTQRVRVSARQLAELGEDAISGLIDLTSLRLVRYATTITRNQHDAEDAVQAAIVKVAAQPGRLHQCEDPWAFLLRMVRNESLVILRRRPRWNLFGDLCDLLTRCRVDELEREESYRAIWRAMRSLPTQQSEVVVLKIWEEMTFAEIAAVLEITPSTAASRYRYAVAKLSDRLSGELGEAAHFNGQERGRSHA